VSREGGVTPSAEEWPLTLILNVMTQNQAML
jgi:hypothetical protein